jgi:predicted nucleic acid-binding protein
VEVVSAVARRHRAGGISAAGFASILSQLDQDFTNEYRVIQIPFRLITGAMSLAQAHGLRGYDAVQLAAALVLKRRCDVLGIAMVLVSADAELIAAATTEGLTSEDPNSHP